MRMKFNIKVLWGLIFIFPLFLSGCYTMVTHPVIENMDEEGNRYSVNVRFYDDCTNCHTSEEIDRNQLIAYEMVKPHTYIDDSGSYEDESFYDEYERSTFTSYRPNFPWWVEFAPMFRNLPLPTRNDDGEVAERGRTPGTRPAGDRGLNDLRLPTQSSGGSSVSKDSPKDSSSDKSRRDNNTRNNRGNRSSNSRRK